MKIVTILGARPQFIKAAAVSRELLKHTNIQEMIIHTGQHYDKNMSDIFFDQMEIPKPHYNLDINGLSHGAMTGQMIERIEKILIEINPDIILLYGDTNSTLAGALTARKLNLKIAHIEGGLRNFDLSIPEDVNRILTDRISDIIFYSTDTAKRNLDAEGFSNFPVVLQKTGDLMADTVLYYSKIASTASTIVKNLKLLNTPYILLTVHRSGNVNEESLRSIFKALNEIARDYKIIFPCHPNTKEVLKRTGISIADNISLIEPVGYFDMLQLLQNATYVISDSGGLQREAYLLQKNTLLLMEYTPWEELVENHFSVLTKIVAEEILDNFYRMTNLKPNYTLNLYGNGDAAAQIVNTLLAYRGFDD